MTGRYSLEKDRNRTLKPGTPHLGELFKKAGYATGIVGKHQPIDDVYVLDGQTEEEKSALRHEKRKYKADVWGDDGRQSKEPKYSFFEPGNYSMEIGPHTASYDYSFLERGPCCTPGGGYFENGKGVRPFDTWAIQRNFPEHRTEGEFVWNDYDTGRHMSRPGISGYVGPPYMDGKTDGPVLVANYPPSILVQKGFDTRYAEQKIRNKALGFIDRLAKHPKKPFFLYYGMRAAHKPFNSPIEYRNKSSVGTVGDSIMELDDNVGDVLDKLDELDIAKNTVVIFLSDNGADPYFRAVYSMYGHYQNSLDYRGKHVELQGGKESLGEGGHRLPMIWRWPRGIRRGINDKDTVSYIDVFATFAEIIGVDLECNEAPDSRSLVPLLTKEGKFSGGSVVHHGLSNKKPFTRKGVFHAIRDGKWKLIDGSPAELYDISKDPGERQNVYGENQDIAQNLRDKLRNILERVDQREAATDFGRFSQCL